MYYTYNGNGKTQKLIKHRRQKDDPNSSGNNTNNSWQKNEVKAPLQPARKVTRLAENPDRDGRKRTNKSGEATR